VDKLAPGVRRLDRERAQCALIRIRAAGVIAGTVRISDITRRPYQGRRRESGGGDGSGLELASQEGEARYGRQGFPDGITVLGDGVEEGP